MGALFIAGVGSQESEVRRKTVTEYRRVGEGVSMGAREQWSMGEKSLSFRKSPEVTGDYPESILACHRACPP